MHNVKNINDFWDFISCNQDNINSMPETEKKLVEIPVLGLLMTGD